MHETNTYANVMHMMTWYEMHDMDKMQNKDKNQTTREYHNLVPKMARVGIQIWQVTYGALHHPSTHNQETFRNHLPQPSKSIRYTSYGNTPELPPSTGWRRGYLTN